MSMVYIYMDESGDIGLKETSSKWFIFAIVLVGDKRMLERAVKKVWKTLHKKHRTMGELHAFHESDVVRKRMLKAIASIKDLRILAIAVNKQKMQTNRHNKKRDIYNISASILLNKLRLNGVLSESEPIELFIDRKDKNKRLNKNFEDYLISSLIDFEQKIFSIILHASHDDKSLQAVDFVAWAIFRKYERGDYIFYDLIKHKIIDEFILFQEKESPSL